MTLNEARDLLTEAREWVTPKPWDDRTCLHARISIALGLPVEYLDSPGLIDEIAERQACREPPMATTRLFIPPDASVATINEPPQCGTLIVNGSVQTAYPVKINCNDVLELIA